MRRTVKKTLVLLMALLLNLLPFQHVQAAETYRDSQSYILTPGDNSVYVDIIRYDGNQETFRTNVPGNVVWYSGNPGVVEILGYTNNSCTVRYNKPGTAHLTLSYSSTMSKLNSNVYHRDGDGALVVDWYRDEVLYSSQVNYNITVKSVLPANNTVDFAGGSGTAADPYLIAAKQHLANINLSTAYTKAHFRLINDISFTEADFEQGGEFYNDGIGWWPIGTPLYFTEGYSFSGVFDGGGFVISGLFGAFTDTAAKLNPCMGLFGANTGTIKNLGVEDSEFQSFIRGRSAFGYGSAGIIAGVNAGTIMNCYTKDSYIAADAAGGIAGNMREGTITDCYSANNKFTLTPSYDASGQFSFHMHGGIVGFLEGGSIDRTYGANFICELTIDGKNYRPTDIGGIIGCKVSKMPPITISNSYYLGVIPHGIFLADDTTAGTTKIDFDQMESMSSFPAFSSSVWYTDPDGNYRYPQLAAFRRAVRAMFVSDMPVKNMYSIGEDLDLTGARLAVVLPDGTMEAFDVSDMELVINASDESIAAKDTRETVYVEGFDSRTVGAKALKLYYRDMSADLEVYVADSTVPDRVSAPTASASDGMVWLGQTVTLATVTLDADIYYTTDGTTPTADSEIYSDPIQIAQDTVLTAVAVKNGAEDSEIMTAEYTVPSSEYYVLTFDKNGGDTEALPRQALAEQGDEPGSLMPMPPVRDKWTFAGWNTAPDGDGTAFAESVITEHVTLYAQWVPAQDRGVPGFLSVIAPYDPNAVKIYTAGDLSLLENSSGSFVLMNDIDLRVLDEWNRIQGFGGVLDGQGHTVIAREGGHSVLFTALKSGSVIKNMAVSGASLSAVVTSGSVFPAVGVLAATAEDSVTIDNCTAQGKADLDIKCTNVTNATVYAGGLIGKSGKVTFRNCETNAILNYKGTGSDATSKLYAGGITGYGGAGFANCVSNGSITSSVTYSSYLSYYNNCQPYTYAGGIVGESGAGFRDCVNNMSISATSRVNGNTSNSFSYDVFNEIGGIVGRTTATQIIGCVNTGAITGNAQLTGDQAYAIVRAGGIAGFANATALTIADCENRGGNISSVGNAPMVDAIAGSILGYMYWNGPVTLTVNDCASTGSTNAAGSGSSLYVMSGGIVGELKANTGRINASFKNIRCSNAPAATASFGRYVGGIVGYASSSQTGGTVTFNPYCYYPGTMSTVGYLWNTTVTGSANVNPSVLPQTAAPAASLPDGGVEAGTAVTLDCATPGASIHYTTDGTTPTASSTRYTAPIVISADTIIKAVAVTENMRDSVVGTITYYLSLPTGDADGNGEIDISDVSLLYLHVRGKQTLTDGALSAGDVTGDGKIDIGDVNLLHMFVRGKIASLK